MKPWRLPLVLFAVGLAVYAAVAGGRLRRASSDPHFAAQAAAWLHGKATIDVWPPGADDPARVEEVSLDDGRVVRGRRLQTRPVFRAFGGEEIPTARVKGTRRTLQYVSFPPVPSLLLLPQAALHGARANDVAFTVIAAALAPALLVLVLRRLRAAKLLDRPPGDDAWLAVLLAFGTVFFSSAVQGRVWFTAHVVGVVLILGYLWAAVEARHPLVAGICLGLAVGTRTPMFFFFPLFLFEAWRVERSRLWSRLLLFAAPAAVIGAALAAYNLARFGELLEFGHSYLAVRQQAQIEQHGLFSPSYLGRNLAVLLTLLPSLQKTAPYVVLPGHGLALWVTTPVLVLLLWPRQRGPLFRPLLVCLVAVAAWSLLYQNSGWLQFGARFSLDYMALLVLLLAVSGRPFGGWTRAFIVVGVVVNLFGALTFNRVHRVYRADNPSYDCVVRH